MIQVPSFRSSESAFAVKEKKREQMLGDAHKVISLSKKAIYAVHRGDFGKAKEHIHTMKRIVSVIQKANEGMVRVAVQEYVEAVSLYGIVVDGKLPTFSSLRVDIIAYLEGLCDLSGEVVRKAVNEAAKGNINEFHEYKTFIEKLYGNLLLFDIRNSELRRKFDRVKYDVKKLEEIAFQLRQQ